MKYYIFVQINPKIKFEVFIHKSDSINEDQKIDNIREMTHRINRKLMVAGMRLRFEEEGVAI